MLPAFELSSSPVFELCPLSVPKMRAFELSPLSGAQVKAAFESPLVFVLSVAAVVVVVVAMTSTVRSTQRRVCACVAAKVHVSTPEEGER